jgi:hypothetical protein
MVLGNGSVAARLVKFGETDHKHTHKLCVCVCVHRAVPIIFIT